MSAALVACLCFLDPADEVVLDRPVPELLAGSLLTAELEATVPAASWQGVECRRALRRLGHDRQIAVLLDRRIDPSRPLTLEVSQQRVADVFAELAGRAGAAVSVAGNTVYVGPRAVAARLRTLIGLRSAELRDLASRLERDRRLALLRRETVHWSDLDDPRRILQDIAARYGLQVANPDLVPHDLWSGATLPDVNVAEALSLVLVQFDLTFRWTAGGGAVELVPVPDEVHVEKTYRPRGVSARQAASAWQREIAGIEAEPRGAIVVVRGTVEQHEAIERLISGRRPDRSPPDGRAPEPVPLEKRTFTIRQRATAAALIETLEKSGIGIEYDAQALDAAGIDLRTEVSLDLTKASADEFFQAWCRPLGLDFTIDGVTVRLSPR